MKPDASHTGQAGQAGQAGRVETPAGDLPEEQPSADGSEQASTTPPFKPKFDVKVESVAC